MNAVEDMNVSIYKGPCSSRFPADVKSFSKFSGPYKNSRMECQSKTWYGENAETSVKSLMCIEPSSSPPNPCKWAESFQYLLEDLYGIKMFKQFFKQEGLDVKILNFLIACRGVKNQDLSDQEASYKLFSDIFKYSKNLSAICPETKQEIRKKLSTKTGVDSTIFDVAQIEVEAFIIKTIYPRFLRSDLYTQLLYGNSPNQDCTLTSEDGENLSKVHVDTKLQKCSYKIHTKSNSMLRYNAKEPSSKFKSVGPRVFLQSPYNYPAKYNSFLSASQDSEFQSLSSDAQSDSSVSVIFTDSNVDTSSQIMQQKCSQKTSKRIIYVNKEKSSNEEKFIPLTQRFNPAKIPKHYPDSLEFYELLCKKLNKVIEDRKVKSRLEKAMQYLGKGNKFFKEENLDKAVLCYTNAIKICPSNQHSDCAVFYTNRAIVYDHLKNYQAAISDATRAIELNNTYSKAFYRRAKAYRKAGELEKSLEDITHACKLDGFQNEDYLEMADELMKELSTISANKDFQEENDEDILDQHISRVFRDRDSQSPDSALYDDSAYCDSPVDYSTFSRDVSQRFACRNPAMNASLSSFFDSGVSVACESEFSYSKVSHSSEIKLAIKQEKKHVNLKKSPTSPDVNRPGKTNKKSCSLDVVEEATASNTVCNDKTIVGYSYGRNSVPYLSRIPGKNVTLGQFKTVLSKKGNFRYFFKTTSNDSDTGVVFEEVNDDHQIVPLLGGRVLCVIETVDDNCVA